MFMFFGVLRIASGILVKLTGRLSKGWPSIMPERMNQPSIEGPFELVYYEMYLNRDDSIGRESFLKSGSGHRYLKKQ